MIRVPVLSLVLAVSSVVLFLALGPASELLVFQRDALWEGEFSRLISAHFIHSDAEHLIWNILAFIILGGLLELREGSKQMLLYLLVGIVSVDLYIVWQSELAAYCGLSGVLNTLLVGVLVSFYREPARRLLVLWVAFAATAKIVVEIVSGEALLTHTLWESVPLAHFYGFTGGLLIAGLGKCYRHALSLPGQLNSSAYVQGTK